MNKPVSFLTTRSLRGTKAGPGTGVCRWDSARSSRDPVLHFWEQTGPFLAGKALPWDTASRSGLQSCWALSEGAAFLSYSFFLQ